MHAFWRYYRPFVAMVLVLLAIDSTYMDYRDSVTHSPIRYTARLGISGLVAYGLIAGKCWAIRICFSAGAVVLLSYAIVLIYGPKQFAALGHRANAAALLAIVLLVLLRHPSTGSIAIVKPANPKERHPPMMKHLEPSLEPISRQKTKPSATAGGSLLKIFLLGAGLIAGLGYGMTAFWNSSSGDHLSDTKKADLAREFSSLKFLEVTPIASQDTDMALSSMPLAPAQRALLKATLSNFDSRSNSVLPTPNVDPTKLVWLVLSDFASEDGDVVHVSTAGYEVDVTLRKLQTRIAVPVDPTNTVKITGVHDGGGGITLAVSNASVPISLPVLQQGQTLVLPLSY